MEDAARHSMAIASVRVHILSDDAGAVNRESTDLDRKGSAILRLVR
jgi:hypothetical protein